MDRCNPATGWVCDIGVAVSSAVMNTPTVGIRNVMIITS
jgi:hypothetical protein